MKKAAYLIWLMAGLFLWLSCWMIDTGSHSSRFWLVFNLLLYFLVFLKCRSVILLRDHLLAFVGLLFFYLLVSLMWSENPGKTFGDIKSISTSYMAILAFNVAFNQKIELDRLLKIYLIIAVAASIYTMTKAGGGSGVSQRMDIEDVGTNVNVIALFATYALLICCYLVKQSKMYFICFPILIYVIALSGCRKSILMLVFCVFAAPLLNALKTKSAKSFRLLVINFFCVIPVILLLFFYLPVINVTRDRIMRMSSSSRDQEGSAKDREVLYQIGYSVFKEHPLVGVGYGCSGNYIIRDSGAGYLHSNYAQLAADTGIAGLLIWYGFSLYYLWRFFVFYLSRTSTSNDGLVLLMILFIFSDLIRDTGNVSICDNFAIFNFLFYSLCLHVCGFRCNYSTAVSS